MTGELNVTLQIAFAERLREIEALHLQAALAVAVGEAGVSAIDNELGQVVDAAALTVVAQAGLRGEVFFAVPVLLQSAPGLLGYYRLLLGISQKEFFRGEFAHFKSLERLGRVSPAQNSRLRWLCTELNHAAATLVANLPALDFQVVRDLQLLTLGPMLRGSRLNEIGKAAATLVLIRIKAAIHSDAIVSDTATELRLLNSSGRVVSVQFSSDPDIAVIESTGSGSLNKLAIEIKGGTDVSNVHNRLGEAEKSHQKAKGKGFSACWTIINASVDDTTARRESPSTSEFFQLARIIDPADSEWRRFRDELTTWLGVPASVG